MPTVRVLPDGTVTVQLSSCPLDPASPVTGTRTAGRCAWKRTLLRYGEIAGTAGLPATTVQSMPVSSFAASDIIEWLHGGSNTRSTSASATVGIISSLVRASSTRMSPMPQPGAVRVSFT